MPMLKFDKKAIELESKEIRNFIKKNKYYPNYATMRDMNGNEHKLKPKEYAGLFESTNVFRVSNNRLPNYVTLNNTANNPLVLWRQPNAYTCCNYSFVMATMMLYSFESPKKVIEEFKTTRNGTTSENLIRGAKKLGYLVKQIGRNYDAVNSSLKQCKPVIAHIQTKNASCLNYINDYGHYVCIYGIKNGKYLIADPTKGLKSCNPKILDRATNGRSIHYYSVEII